tara:strand:+ start:771 stop:935 length:165 start_codon:yes stop_codon:yes gene_type:complete
MALWNRSGNEGHSASSDHLADDFSNEKLMLFDMVVKLVSEHVINDEFADSVLTL